MADRSASVIVFSHLLQYPCVSSLLINPIPHCLQFMLFSVLVLFVICLALADVVDKFAAFVVGFHVIIDDFINVFSH